MHNLWIRICGLKYSLPHILSSCVSHPPDWTNKPSTEQLQQDKPDSQNLPRDLGCCPRKYVNMSLSSVYAHVNFSRLVFQSGLNQGCSQTQRWCCRPYMHPFVTAHTKPADFAEHQSKLKSVAHCLGQLQGCQDTTLPPASSSAAQNQWEVSKGRRGLRYPAGLLEILHWNINKYRCQITGRKCSSCGLG